MGVTVYVNFICLIKLKFQCLGPQKQTLLWAESMRRTDLKASLNIDQK